MKRALTAAALALLVAVPNAIAAPSGVRELRAADRQVSYAIEDARAGKAGAALRHIARAETKLELAREAIEGPEPSPTPPAEPEPSPEPSPEPTPEPSPEPTPIDPGDIPPSSETRGKQLRFSILCPVVREGGDVRRENIDPLVSPGRRSSHTHTFFGARFVTPIRDVDATRDSGTTCQFSGDTGAYWIPVLYDRSGDPIDPVQVLVYYRHSERRGTVVKHPEDHGIIATEHQYICRDSDSFSSPPDCRDKHRHPLGAGLRIVFDSERVNGGSTPRVAFNIRYGRLDLTGAHLGRNDDGSLVSEHGDFWNTWVQRDYATLVNRCLNQDGVWLTYTTAEWERRCAKVTDADFAIGD